MSQVPHSAAVLTTSTTLVLIKRFLNISKEFGSKIQHIYYYDAHQSFKNFQSDSDLRCFTCTDFPVGLSWIQPKCTFAGSLYFTHNNDDGLLSILDI